MGGCKSAKWSVITVNADAQALMGPDRKTGRTAPIASMYRCPIKPKSSFTKFHQRPAMLAQFYSATFRVNVKKVFDQPRTCCYGEFVTVTYFGERAPMDVSSSPLVRRSAGDNIAQ
jgi:hypothetical protein